MKSDFIEYCCCPLCTSDLQNVKDGLKCLKCQRIYEVRNGIPVLLPNYEEDKQKRYIECCQKMAVSDINNPMEQWRNCRHDVMAKFIGEIKGKRILDIGSSNALFLNEIETDFRVAFDIAIHFLENISRSSEIIPICGDAEFLPFKPGFFDVIILSDILEHVLNPKNVIGALEKICNPKTRLIVHVPWEENLEHYINYEEFEFAHLRQFNAFALCDLFRNFYIKRQKNAYPNLNRPYLFNLFGKIPLFIFNKLVHRYFFTPNIADKDYKWRIEIMNSLPKNEWLLLLFFKPHFKIFEMKLKDKK